MQARGSALRLLRSPSRNHGHQFRRCSSNVSAKVWRPEPSHAAEVQVRGGLRESHGAKGSQARISDGRGWQAGVQVGVVRRIDLQVLEAEARLPPRAVRLAPEDTLHRWIGVELDVLRQPVEDTEAINGRSSVTTASRSTIEVSVTAW